MLRLSLYCNLHYAPNLMREFYLNFMLSCGFHAMFKFNPVFLNGNALFGELLGNVLGGD